MTNQKKMKEASILSWGEYSLFFFIFASPSTTKLTCFPAHFILFTGRHQVCWWKQHQAKHNRCNCRACYIWPMKQAEMKNREKWPPTRTDFPLQCWITTLRFLTEPLQHVWLRRSQQWSDHCIYFRTDGRQPEDDKMKGNKTGKMRWK